MNSPEKTGKRPGKMLLLFLEVLLWVNGLILLLAVVAGIAFQLPAVQTFAAQKATVFLASRLNTKVSIGRFTTDWRNSIVLKEIYIEDQHRDTLLYAGRLGLDLSIFGLKRNRLSIRSASIENGRLNIHSSLADSAYNFSFISAAFNGKKPGAEIGNAAAFSFKLRNLKLKIVRLNLSDPIKGNFGKATIGNFTAQLEEFDTAKPGYHLGSLKLENTAVKWKKTKAPVSTKKPQNRQFTFKKIRLKNSRFHWLDLPAARRVVARIGNAEVNADKIALPDARADLSQISLQNSDLAIYRLKALPADTAELKPELGLQPSGGIGSKGKTGNLAVWVKEIKFKKVAFRYRNFNVPARSRGFDLADLDMTGVNLGLRNLYYSQKSITAALENMQLKEKSGFRIKALKGSLKANASGFSLQDFELKTNGSLIRSGIEMEFMPAPGNKPAKTAISVNFRHAKLVPQDILYLLPDLRGKPFFRKLGNRKLLLNGTISGFTTDLAFRNFEVNGWTGTRLHFSGNVKEITNPERRLLNLKISKLTTNRNDLNLLLAGDGGSAKIRFPAQVSLSGNVLSRQDFLKLDNFRLAASNGTAIHTSGTISGRPASKYLNLEVKDMVTTRTALLEMLPPGTITPEVQLPDRIRFVGKYQGSSLRHFALNGFFTTTFGNIQADVKVVPVQQFSGHIRLEEFNLGKLLKQENTLGKATGKADFQGKGFKVQTMQLHYDADVKKFVYKKETWHNIRLEGNLNQKIYQLNGNLANAALQGLGHKLKKVKPGNLDLKKANPTRLIPKKVRPKRVFKKIFGKKEKEEGEEGGEK